MRMLLTIAFAMSFGIYRLAWCDIWTIPMADDLDRVIAKAAKADEKIRNSGLLYDSEIVTAYLQNIMDKLFPEHKHEFELHLFTSTNVNAFVLANGSVYINIGLLAKAENEAQIATVLAHEGAHYIREHQLLSRDALLDVASGAAFFGVERTLSLLSDYSQDLEREADSIGYQHFLAAKYDPTQSVRIFELLAEEMKDTQTDNSTLYNTHPKIIDRIEHYAHLSENKTGYQGKEIYLDKVRQLILALYKLEISKLNYSSVIFSLKDNNRIADAPPEAWYYLGEAYRQRGADDDISLATQAYLRTVEMLPKFAPSYQALGMIYMKDNSQKKAKENFKKYLSLSPGGPSNAYASQYYDKLRLGN